MPAGDPQRVWFPEMIEQLRTRWLTGISFEAMVELRDDLEAMLQRIRHERNVKNPIIKCPCCNRSGPAADPHVSVRAMILSTKRFEITSAEETHAVEKAWALHRKQHSLDIYGVASVAGPVAATCEHGPPRR
jgi:hypothetical protein